MARARNIKPGFFKNEDLCELDPIDRLLFIGLWTLADREGRLEDRPKRIKMELFPCDNLDTDAALGRLAHGGFITRYEVEGFLVIGIPNFIKHQSPHGTEKDSELPDENGFLTVHERGKGGCITGATHTRHVKKLENNVKPRESTKRERPDSPNPDSLNPDSIKQPPSTTNISEAGESHSSPPSRSAQILTKISSWEAARGLVSKILTSNKLLAAWVAAGINDGQLREAYEMAVSERVRQNDRTPINAGFLDTFVAKVLNPPDARSSVAGVVKAWYETAPGIEAKGAELGIPPPSAETGGFPAFKDRVLRSAGIGV